MKSYLHKNSPTTRYKILPFNFDFEGHPIRAVIGHDGELYWVANDVCVVLDIANISDTLTRLDNDEKGEVILDKAATDQAPVCVINESGLYRLILESNQPEAQHFKRWITHEVIPAIRRTEIYRVSLHTTPPEIAVLESLVADLERRVSALEFAQRRKHITVGESRDRAVVPEPPPEVARSYGLTLKQLNVLIAMRDFPDGTTPIHLGELTQMYREAAVSNILNRLAQRGYVTRKGLRGTWFLTDEGKSFLESHTNETESLP